MSKKWTVLIEARYSTEVVVEAESQQEAIEKADELDFIEDVPWHVEMAGQMWRLPDGEPAQAMMAFENSR